MSPVLHSLYWQLSRWKWALLVTVLLSGFEAGAWPEHGKTNRMISLSAPPTTECASPAQMTVHVNQAMIDGTISINGTAADSATHAPLAGAMVSLIRGEDTTVTCCDLYGRFSAALEGVRPGDSVNVEIRFTGFTTYTVTVFTSATPGAVMLNTPVEYVIVGGTPEPEQPYLVSDRRFFRRLFHPRNR